ASGGVSQRFASSLVRSAGGQGTTAENGSVCRLTRPVRVEVGLRLERVAAGVPAATPGAGHRLFVRQQGRREGRLVLRHVGADLFAQFACGHRQGGHRVSQCRRRGPFRQRGQFLVGLGYLAQYHHRAGHADPHPDQAFHECFSPRRNSPRTAIENAATLISGAPTVAATSEVSAETFVETSAAAVVTVSTLAICPLVELIVVAASSMTGTVWSVTSERLRRASSITRPSLSSGTARAPTSSTKAIAAMRPAMSPRDMALVPPGFGKGHPC